jgi:hypothetical protein
LESVPTCAGEKVDSALGAKVDVQKHHIYNAAAEENKSLSDRATVKPEFQVGLGVDQMS